MANELGELLRELRGKKPLREIAERAGISHTYLSDLEKGYRRGTGSPLKPSPEILMGLSKALNYSYEDLMRIAGYIHEESDLNTDDPGIQIMLRAKDELSPEAYQELIDWTKRTKELLEKSHGKSTDK